MHQQKDQTHPSPATQKPEHVKSDNNADVDIYDFQPKTLNQQFPNSDLSQPATTTTTTSTLLQTEVAKSEKQQQGQQQRGVVMNVSDDADDKFMLNDPQPQKHKSSQTQNDDILTNINLEDLASDQDTAWFEEKIAQVEHKFDFPDDNTDENKAIDTSVFDEEDEIVRQVYMTKYCHDIFDTHTLLFLSFSSVFCWSEFSILDFDSL
jgi:hypothetical protein